MKYVRSLLGNISLLAGMTILVGLVGMLGCGSSTSSDDDGYSIRGTITDSAGNPVAGVTVSLTGEATKSTTTNADGEYTLSGLEDGNYVVTPAQSGASFTPGSESVLVDGGNLSGIDFTITTFMLMLAPQDAAINGVGGSTQVAVTAEMADGIISARFTLSFDPSLVEATTIKTSGAGYLFTEAGANVIPGETTIDNTNGTVVVGVLAQKQGFTGADGDGILATITFVSKRSGSGNITFVQDGELDLFVGVYDENAQAGFAEITAPTQNGTITVQ